MKHECLSHNELQYEFCILNSKSWEEAIEIASNFYQCPESHTKTITRLYRKDEIEIPVFNLIAADFEGIACIECKNKKFGL
jgi:hypothetical protein